MLCYYFVLVGKATLLFLITITLGCSKELVIQSKKVGDVSVTSPVLRVSIGTVIAYHQVAFAVCHGTYGSTTYGIKKTTLIKYIDITTL